MSMASEKANVSFLSGQGWRYTLKNQLGKDYAGIGWSDIAGMVTDPQNIAKMEASWFIPSVYKKHDGRDQEVQKIQGEFHMLTADIDEGNSEIACVINAVHECLGAVALIIYSTASATEEAKKWRVLVPNNTPFSGLEYGKYQTCFFQLLEEKGIKCDASLAKPTQLVNLPNVPPDKRNCAGKPFFYQHQIIKDDVTTLTLTDDHILTQRFVQQVELEKKIELELDERRVKRQKNHAERSTHISAQNSSIDEFNLRNTIAKMLAKYQYKQQSCSDNWQSIYQTSRSFATVNYGTHWVSHSSSDVNHGLGVQKENCCWGDAFDLYNHFEHQGDSKAAVRAYTQETLQNVTQSGQIDISDFFPKDGEVSLIKTSSGQANLDSLTGVLFNSSCFAKVFAYDEMAERKILMEPLPSSTAPRKTWQPREITDYDILQVQRWFQRNGFPRALKHTVADAIELACHEHIISPIKHYLEGLQPFDPSVDESLIETWMHKFLGVDTPTAPAKLKYIQAASRVFLMQAVARAINPGCQADTVVILEGLQGTGKSSALRILAGDRYFGDALPPIQTKDASNYVRGKWIVELAEMEFSKKAEVEAQKAFISRREEKFRPAYAREEIVYLRRCVLVGTTNRSDYLRDETGNRRFLPVETGKIDLKGLENYRDKLWSEATYLYNQDVPYWLKEDEKLVAEIEQADRIEEDAWFSAVRKFMVEENIEETSIGQAFKSCFPETTDARHISKSDTRRMGKALRHAGYNQDGKFTSGGKRNQKRFVLG